MNEELRPLSIGDKLLGYSYIFVICGAIGIWAYLFIPPYLADTEALNQKIDAMNCQELAVHIRLNTEGWFSGRAGDNFRTECLPNSFNKEYASAEKFYNYFTTTNCNELQTWVLYQYPYFERATHEYEWRCNK